LDAETAIDGGDLQGRGLIRSKTHSQSLISTTGRTQFTTEPVNVRASFILLRKL
jgi:hypothetical protein